MQNKRRKMLHFFFKYLYRTSSRKISVNQNNSIFKRLPWCASDRCTRNRSGLVLRLGFFRCRCTCRCCHNWEWVLDNRCCFRCLDFVYCFCVFDKNRCCRHRCSQRHCRRDTTCTWSSLFEFNQFFGLFPYRLGCFGIVVIFLA